MSASLSRRSLLAATAAAGLVTTVGCAQKSTGSSSSATTAASGSASGSGGAGGTINVFLSGDTNMQDLWEKALGPGFAAANPGWNVKVQLDLHGEHDAQTQAKLTAAQQSGSDAGIDLVDAGFVSSLAKAGVMEPVSTSNVPNLDGIDAKVVAAGNGGGIPYRGSSVLLVFDTKKVTTPPKTLDEVLAWIKANPGQFTYCPPKSGGSGGAFVTTVLDKFLTAEQADVLRTKVDDAAMKGWDKGFAELAGLNPSIFSKGVYPNGNKQALELLTSGQISMTTAWSDQYLSGKQTGLVGDNISASQISNPSFTGGAAYLGVVKGSKNKEAALKLANYVLSPEAQQKIVETIAGFPVIPLDKMDAKSQAMLKAAHPDVMRPGYFGDVGSEMNKQWDQKVPNK